MKKSYTINRTKAKKLLLNYLPSVAHIEQLTDADIKKSVKQIFDGSKLYTIKFNFKKIKTMKNIQFTDKELDCLQSMMAHLVNQENWVQSRNSDSLMICEVLSSKNELDFELLEKIDSKLYD
jgi:hypothetical protein